jgi:hypothetical protein
LEKQQGEGSTTPPNTGSTGHFAGGSAPVSQAVGPLQKQTGRRKLAMDEANSKPTSQVNENKVAFLVIDVQQW